MIIRKIEDYFQYSDFTRPSMRFIGGGGGSKVKTFDPLAGTGVRELYKDVNKWISPYIGQGIQGYPGQRVPELTPIHETAFATAEGMPSLSAGTQDILRQAIPGYQPETSFDWLSKAGGVLEDITQPFDTEKATKFWQSKFVEPSMDVFEQKVIPAIMERYGEGSKSSSALDLALGGASKDFMTNLSGQLADILYSGEQANLGRRQTGANQLIGMAGAPVNLLQQILGLAGGGADLMGQSLNIANLQRSIGGEQLGAERDIWTEAQPWNNPILQRFLPMALQQPGMTPVVEQQAQSPWSTMLGGIGYGLGTGSFGTALGTGLSSLGGSLLGGLGGLFGGSAAGAAGATGAASTIPWFMI